jgi:hypothetical protein
MTFDEVNAKSQEMNNRALTFERDVSGQLRELLGKDGLAARVKEVGLWGMKVTDQMVAYPTWVGAYEHALAPKEKKGLGMSEADAIQHADRTVRLALASGATKDLPAIMRSKEARAFTMFYGFMNSQLNQLFAASADASRQWGDRERYRAIKTLTKTMMFLASGAILSEMLTGKGPDDDDPDGLEYATAKWMARKAIFAPVMWVPVLSSVARAMESGRDASFTPYSRVFDAAARAATGGVNLAAQALADEEVGLDDVLGEGRRVLETIGYFKGLPVAQATATGTYAYHRWVEGDEPDGGAGQTALGLAFGRQRRGKIAQLLYGDE